MTPDLLPGQCHTCGHVRPPALTEADIDLTTCPHCKAYDPTGRFDDVPHLPTCPTVTHVSTATVRDIAEGLGCSADGCTHVFQFGEPYTHAEHPLCLDCSARKDGTT